MERVFFAILAIGFWGSMIHPIFAIPLAIGAIGTNYYEKKGESKK